MRSVKKRKRVIVFWNGGILDSRRLICFLFPVTDSLIYTIINSHSHMTHRKLLIIKNGSGLLIVKHCLTVSSFRIKDLGYKICNSHRCLIKICGRTTYEETTYDQTSAVINPPMVNPPMSKLPMVKPPRTFLKVFIV